jgi:hypothetical protein
MSNVIERNSARNASHSTRGPINGSSQWIWGRQAPFENRFSVRYTIVGYAIHHAPSVFWRFGLSGLVKKWGLLRDEIHGEVLARGYDRDRNTFVQHYGELRLMLRSC